MIPGLIEQRFDPGRNERAQFGRGLDHLETDISDLACALLRVLISAKEQPQRSLSFKK